MWSSNSGHKHEKGGNFDNFCIKKKNHININVKIFSSIISSDNKNEIQFFGNDQPN